MKLKLRGDTLVEKNHAGDDVFVPALFWPTAWAFLEDWGRPLGELLPKDVSHHGDELRHRIQTGLRAVVRDSEAMCGLRAMDGAGEALAGRLDAILGVSGKVGLPAAFYAPCYLLREWISGQARALAHRGLSDAEWAQYVKMIGSGA
jgi:hypothetical protein